LYERSEDTDGKYTVPILWDKHTNTIVNNESSEIIRMLNSEFNAFAKSSLDLYPEGKRAAIDEANEWIYPSINNGVYRCGFATSQSAYDNAIDELTTSFDRVDKILQNQRFIASDDKVTEADIRLFATLLRFDEVYTVYFKTNSRSVAATPSILNYCREIFALPGVAETCNMEQIKAHYYCSHTELNKWSIIPRGEDFMKLLKQPATNHE
jgi:putative glutathione S-transferase